MKWLVMVRWKQLNGGWAECYREFEDEEDAYNYAKEMYDSMDKDISVCVYERRDVFC